MSSRPSASFRSFPVEGVEFLSALARNNRREWFVAHKPDFERHAKEPMLALLAALNDVLADVSPACVTPPAKALMRMNRDVRFSKDKSPYRTSLGARLGGEGGRAAESGGYYVGLSPLGVEIAGGAHALEPVHLTALREHLASDASRFRALVQERALVRAMGELQGERLVRVPRAFPADHPAGDLLRLKQAYFLVRLDADLTTSPKLLPELERRIRLLAPFVNLLATWL